MATTQRILVVYYSLSGNTAKVAEDLARRLDADIEIIHDTQHGAGWLGYFRAIRDAWQQKPAIIRAPRRNPAHYELTVIGTPVWSRKMTPAIRAYLQQTGGNLRKAAFFITSGNTDIGKIVRSLEAAAGCKSIASAGFNARELNNPATYDTKLVAFVHSIRTVIAPAAGNAGR